jgi:hypothetical protein
LKSIYQVYVCVYEQQALAQISQISS